MPTTGYVDPRGRYIARLLESGWTIKQLQESGLSVEELSADKLTTTELSTVSLSTEVLSTFSETSTTSEYSASTLPSVTSEYIPSTEYSTFDSNLNGTSHETISYFDTVSDKITEAVNLSVPTTEKIVNEITKNIYFERGISPADSDFSHSYSESLVNSTIWKDQYFTEPILVSDNGTQLVSMRDLTQDFMIDDDQNSSGFNWLFREWLPSWFDIVTEKVNGSLVLPVTGPWEHVDPTRADIGSEISLSEGEVPDVVTLAGLPLHRDHLLLILLAAVAFCLSEYAKFLLKV